MTYTQCLKKMHQLWNGIAQNCTDRLGWFLAEIFKSLYNRVCMFQFSCRFAFLATFRLSNWTPKNNANFFETQCSVVPVCPWSSRFPFCHVQFPLYRRSISSILKTWPDHLSLLSLTISSIFSNSDRLIMELSFRVMPKTRLWNSWCVASGKGKDVHYWQWYISLSNKKDSIDSFSICFANGNTSIYVTIWYERRV